MERYDYVIIFHQYWALHKHGKTINKLPAKEVTLVNVFGINQNGHTCDNFQNVNFKC